MPVLRRAGLVIVTVAACVVAAANAAVAAASPPGLAFRNSSGLHVVSAQRLNARLYAVAVRTAALPGIQNVRILLPAGYSRHPKRRYPVLYLFDGTSGHASDWTTLGAAQQITAARPLIVVMPDITLNGNGGGWCTNWPDGAERWESYHIDQAVPWIDRNLRTIRSRAGRAIAGLSQGGFCSLSYAARHPDLFATALGYSAAPDIWSDQDARLGAIGIINATELGLTRVPPDTFFGNPVSDAINWAAHDPARLADNLRHTRIYLYWGNGLPGPFDQGAPNPEAMGIEAAIRRDNEDFQARLDALGIPAYFNAYGNGTHSWPYWKRDLSWSIGQIMHDFGHPLPPTAITYISGDMSFRVFGWSVRMHRAVREFVTLANATRAGFQLAGSGSATVVTPARFRAGRRYRVSLFGPYVHRTLLARAGSDRRLTLQVRLGPSNPYAQYTPQAQAAGTKVYMTDVTVAR